MTELYFMHISQAEGLEEYAKQNFPKRYERSLRYLRREDALRCIAAGALESFALKVPEKCILINEYGKPYLEGSPFFSVSHSGDYALLALSDRDIGADIEKLTSADMTVADRVFTPDELQWMREDPGTRFFTLWTMKESIMKLDGRGMSLPPESFSVLPLMKGGSIQLGNKELFGYTETADGYAVALCSDKPLANVKKLLMHKNFFTNK